MAEAAAAAAMTTRFAHASAGLAPDAFAGKTFTVLVARGAPGSRLRFRPPEPGIVARS